MFKQLAFAMVLSSVSHAVLAETVTTPGGAEYDSDLKAQVLADPASVELGNKKFHAVCGYCHGANGSGGKGKKIQGRTFEPDYLYETITNGRKRGGRNMPAWAGLPEDVRWQLVAFIMSLSDQ